MWSAFVEGYALYLVGLKEYFVLQTPSAKSDVELLFPIRSIKCTNR